MTTFYAVCAGASATLVGLLFVAIQIGPSLLATGGVTRRHAMARSTFTIFVVIFALSLFFLVPVPVRARATTAIFASIAGAARAARTWLPVWRETLRQRTVARVWQAVWLLLGPIAAYAYVALGGLIQLSTGRSVLDAFASGAFIVLFVIALRNSWDLLVEATAR